MKINFKKTWAIGFTLLAIIASAKASIQIKTQNIQLQFTQLGLGVQAIDVSNFYESNCNSRIVPTSQVNELDYLLRQYTGANNREWLDYLNDDPEARTVSNTLAERKLVCDQKELKFLQGLFSKNVTNAIEMFRKMKLTDQYLQFPKDLPEFTMDEATRIVKEKLLDWRSLPPDEIRDLAHAFSLTLYNYARYSSETINPKSMNPKISIELFEHLYKQTSEPSLLYDIAYAKLNNEPDEAIQLIEKAAGLKEERAILWLMLKKRCQQSKEKLYIEQHLEIIKSGNPELTRIIDRVDRLLDLGFASYGCNRADMKYLPYFKSGS